MMNVEPIVTSDGEWDMYQNATTEIVAVGANAVLSDSNLNDKRPKFVEVSIKIYNISEINCIEATFQTSIKLFYRWDDSKLVGHPEGPVNEDIPGLFEPEIIIANEFEVAELSRERRVVDSKVGKVKMSVSYRGKMFMMDMGLKYFPFDGQNLQIMLRSAKMDESQVILEYSAEQSASDYHPVHEWRFVGFCAKRYRTDPQTSSTGKTYSSLHIVVCVQRESWWFVSNIILPVFALTCVSWSTFGLYPAYDYGVRMNCNIVVILATIANKFVVADHLPRVPYRTLTDIHLDVSFLLQVLAVMASLFVGRWADARSEYNTDAWAEEYMNGLFFYLGLVVYGVFHLWFFVVLWDHFKDLKRWEEGVVEQTKREFLNAKQKNIVKKKPNGSPSNGSTESGSRKYSEKLVAMPQQLLQKSHEHKSKKHIMFHVSGHVPLDDEEELER